MHTYSADNCNSYLVSNQFSDCSIKSCIAKLLVAIKYPLSASFKSKFTEAMFAQWKNYIFQSFVQLRLVVC